MRSAWVNRLFAPPSGWRATGVLVLATIYLVGLSTVTASWVPHEAVLPGDALLAGIVLGVLAISRARWPAAALALLAAPVAAYFFAAGYLQSLHPLDPVGVGSVGPWLQRMRNGEAASDPAFFLYLLCVLFWFASGWLSWAVLRLRQPLIGLVPLAAIFSANVLNYPTDQNFYTITFIFLTLALLLWTGYRRSLADASSAGIKLSNDARWDFWEGGGAISLLLVVLSVFLPPLSTADSTVDLENGVFRSWADLQQRLNHPVALGRGSGSGNSVGFADDVPLGGPVHQTGGVVMVYTVEGRYSGPRYFRGLNLARTASGEWSYQPVSTIKQMVPKDQRPPYSEDYLSHSAASFKVTMLKPPRGFADVVFYPDQLFKIDRPVVASESAVGAVAACGSITHPASCSLGIPGSSATSVLQTVDRVTGLNSTSSAGSYRVVAEYSTASEDELRQARTNYPVWVAAYGQNPANPGRFGRSYRTPEAEDAVARLAQQATAGASTPYDKAQAVERFLRSNYGYSLTPPVPPAGTDPLQYFLTDSKVGYCQYFASAMGDMLRSLGIPTRLVNGYGPGTYDQKSSRWVVRESDAHTWVEVYFPQYGWIPFEPTPDGTYFPIPRGQTTDVVCRRDSCDLSGDTGQAAAVPPRADPHGIIAGEQGGSPTVGGIQLPPARYWPPVLALLALLLGAAAYGASRYLRPHTIAGVWKRTGFLSRIAGVPRGPAETPLEFGARLGRELPETADVARRLAAEVTVAAYSRAAGAASRRAAVVEAWEALRPLLLRHAIQRLRPAH
jgi:hypothetical protein